VLLLAAPAARFWSRDCCHSRFVEIRPATFLL